jgi:hypothetical protein
VRILFKSWRNPLDLSLAAFHASALIVLLAAKEPLPDETVPMKFLMIADIPAILVASMASLPWFWIFREDQLRQSWFSAAGWMGFGSLQWWMLGTYFYSRRKPIH